MQNFINSNHPAKGIPRVYTQEVFSLDKSMYNWVDEINTNQKKTSQYKNIYFFLKIFQHFTILGSLSQKVVSVSRKFCTYDFPKCDPTTISQNVS